MRLSLYEHPAGVETVDGPRIVYDLARDVAVFGAASVDGAALVFELGDADDAASLSAEIDLDGVTDWIARCDRIDFPPGGVAWRHTHPGGGIRRLLFGSIEVAGPDEQSHTFGPGGAWFEGADYSVLATASTTEPTAFVRVLVLPAEWAGKRTIRYVDPADEDKPKLQRPTVYLEHPLALG